VDVGGGSMLRFASFISIGCYIILYVWRTWLFRIFQESIGGRFYCRTFVIRGCASIEAENVLGYPCDFGGCHGPVQCVSFAFWLRVDFFFCRLFQISRGLRMLSMALFVSLKWSVLLGGLPWSHIF